MLDRLAGLEPDADLTAAFALHPLPGAYRAGPFELTGVPLPHFVPNAGIRVQAGQNVLAYSGDTAPDPMLAELGRDADLFIIESTDRAGETQRPEPYSRPPRASRSHSAMNPAGNRSAPFGRRWAKPGSGRASVIEPSPTNCCC